VAVEETGPDFSARWSAKGRFTVTGSIGGSGAATAVALCAALSVSLDEEAMKDARRDSWARTIHVVRGFDGFGRRRQRTQYAARDFSTELQRTEEGEELWFTVHGRSFLRYMVRKMVGALLEVGRGKLVPADIEKLYELKDRSKSGLPLPPQGLFMVTVDHDLPYRVG